MTQVLGFSSSLESSGDRDKIFLRDILGVQSKCFNSRSISNVLGDGYLYMNNPIYRGLRDRFLNLGLGFTNDDLTHSSVFYFFNLNGNTNRKKVLYFDNVTPLRALERKVPGLFLIDDVGSMYIKRNILLYEAARCIGHNVMFEGNYLNEFLPKNENTMLNIIVSEAYSIANEIIARLFARDILHRFFIKYCSARSVPKESRRVYRELMFETGYAEVFRICLLGILARLCFLDIESESEFLRFTEASLPDTKFSDKHWPLRYKVFKSMTISQNFQIGCAMPFFKYLGFSNPHERIIKMKILEVFRGDPALHENFLNLASHYR